MNGNKSALQSKTIWGGIIIALAQIARATGLLDIGEAESQTLVTAIDGIVNAVGVILVFLGRFKANTTIGEK